MDFIILKILATLNEHEKNLSGPFFIFAPLKIWESFR
jgi:hypothetical protein